MKCRRPTWLLQMFCKHEWITMFRGTVTRGVQCRLCDKSTLLEEHNNSSETLGWVNDR